MILFPVLFILKYQFIWNPPVWVRLVHIYYNVKWHIIYAIAHHLSEDFMDYKVMKSERQKLRFVVIYIV